MWDNFNYGSGVATSQVPTCVTDIQFKSLSIGVFTSLSVWESRYSRHAVLHIMIKGLFPIILAVAIF